MGDQCCELTSNFGAYENSELKRKVRELTEKFRLAEQRKDQAEKQVLVLGDQKKARSFGTVKGLRTNPSVVPDESVNPRLAKVLEKVAVNKEIIVALANSNVKEMLEVWFTNIKRVGIPNYLVLLWMKKLPDTVKQIMCQYIRETQIKALILLPEPGGTMMSLV
ncbi:hypothetical protein ACLB2K_067158 [Fragaria x ananassa]